MCLNCVIEIMGSIPYSRNRFDMADRESPVPDELLTSARERLEQVSITLVDNEEILHALSEPTPVYETDWSYFVLGNYDREPIRRLNLVVDRLNRTLRCLRLPVIDIRGVRDNSI